MLYPYEQCTITSYVLHSKGCKYIFRIQPRLETDEKYEMVKLVDQEQYYSYF